MADQHGRSSRKPESYGFEYIEGGNDTRTKPAIFFNLLGIY